MKLFKNQKGNSLIELVTTIAIMSTITATVTPVYIHYVEKAKIVADEAVLNDAVNLAIAMNVMQETSEKEMYYTSEAEFVTTSYNVIPYGQSSENENSIVKVSFDNNRYDATWIKVKGNN